MQHMQTTAWLGGDTLHLPSPSVGPMPACGKVFARIVRPPPVQAIASGGNRAAVAIHGDGCGCAGESSHTTSAHGRRRAAVQAAAPEGVWRDKAVKQQAGCAEPERPSKQETKITCAHAFCARSRKVAHRFEGGLGDAICDRSS
jgi:hypothetical protein